MKKRTQNQRKPLAWEGTNGGGLLRHVKSGTYYSRISVGSKLRWGSLLNIMMDCGLNNPSHFYALFRKHYGETLRQSRLLRQGLVGQVVG